MMVSLVISTYNGEKYIEQQLESIRFQTMIPNEVIIRDDCSTDGTVDIVKRYIKANNLSWQLEINEKNEGYKANFYNCIVRTKGDYIFLCDQDDIWKPEKIETMVQVFMNNPQIWTLNCGVELIDEKNSIIKSKCEKGWQNANFLYAPKELSMIQSFDLSYILRHNVTPGCAMAIDKRTKEGFLKTYEYGIPHDWHMNMIAAANGGCAYLNQVLILYRRHSANAIGANTGAMQGIKSKTREVRIEDYKARIDACRSICKFYGIEEPDMKLMHNMISFYKSPNPIKLARIHKMNGYGELAKRKVKLWEYVVALRLDRIIGKIVGA